MADIQKTVESTLTTLLSKMDAPFEKVEIREIAGQILYAITVQPEQEELLIGHNGERLNALSMIVSRLVEKEAGNNDERVRITIDVNGYKEEKIQTIVDAAQVQAKRVKELKYDVELQPQNPYERMLVHAALANDPQIETGSIGEDSERRVAIKFVG